VAPQKRVKVWAVRNSAGRGIFVSQAGGGRLEDKGASRIMITDNLSVDVVSSVTEVPYKSTFKKFGKNHPSL
jgi:hypothetical protein